jgi:GT2 family glycosyltransferase
MRQEAVPADALEVLVIDNRSTDATKQVIESFERRHAAVRYVFESQLGLSVARNTGLAEASAPLVAYVDDDAFAEPQWAAALLDAFASVAVVAGRVFPEWETTPPDCMTPFLEALFTVHDRGDEPRLMTPREYFVGANMAFRRDVLRELGGFEPRLGRIGSSLLSNEETHLRDELTRRGFQCAYAPRAVVHHHIGKDRLTPAYIRRRLLAQGQSDVTGAILGQGPQPFVARAKNCLLDAARVTKHSIRSCFLPRGQSATYARQLAVVSLGRLQTSFRELVSPTPPAHG